MRMQASRLIASRVARAGRLRQEFPSLAPTSLARSDVGQGRLAATQAQSFARPVRRCASSGTPTRNPVEVGEGVAIAHAAEEARRERVPAGVDGQRGGAGLGDADLLAVEWERAERYA